MLRGRLRTSEQEGRNEQTNVDEHEYSRGAYLVYPRMKVNVFLAFMATLLLGVGVAFFLDYLDRTIKTAEDVERLVGAPLLGIIPIVTEVPTGDDPKAQKDRDLYVFRNPTSQAAECCRSIRTNILFSAADRPMKTITVSSPRPREGKTTSTIYTGTIMAQSGQRVLLVDTDLRRPRLHKSLGVSKNRGLTNLILGDATVDDVIKSTDIPNLYVLPCGPQPPNPAELLLTNRFKQVLAELESKFDRILLDSPPVLAVTDAVVLGPAVVGRDADRPGRQDAARRCRLLGAAVPRHRRPHPRRDPERHGHHRPPLRRLLLRLRRVRRARAEQVGGGRGVVTPDRSARWTGASPALSGSHAAVGRRSSKAAELMLDAVLVMVAGLLAYVARFEGRLPPTFFLQLAVIIPALVVLRIIANQLFGVYRLVWRYVGLAEALRFAQATATVSALLLVSRFTIGAFDGHFIVPFSIVIMEGALSFFGMVGARFIPRIRSERARPDAGLPTVIIGAGQGGLSVAKEAVRHPELGIRPIGFLDDDPTKAGKEIGNLRVLGTVADVVRVVRATGAERVIISSASIPSKVVARVMDACTPLGVEVKIVRGVYEALDATAASGDDGAGLVREVRIEDLLARDPVPPSLSLDDLRRHYGGKRVLVTGAGGSIGSELCRQLAGMGLAKLYLCERDETNLFEIERELAGVKNLGGVVTPVLLDIMDAKALERTFKDLQPQIVFHAAAYKHVPMMERFPWEAVRNNVFATKQLAELADEHGVESFVMISTDKVINPTSVMGATKRFAEQLVQEMAPRSKTRFSCVRFGNVLGSRGSVVGIFRDQIARGGPVTVTHPRPLATS
jgi:capsular exopolysaccharide synthesis family protein